MIKSRKYYLTSKSNIYIFIGLLQIYRNNRKCYLEVIKHYQEQQENIKLMLCFYWLLILFRFIAILYFMECIYKNVANATKYIESIAKTTKSFDIVLFLLYRKIVSTVLYHVIHLIKLIQCLIILI
jgi:hypothetical protein